MALCFRGTTDQLSQPPGTQAVALAGRTEAISVLASVLEPSLSKNSLDFRIKIQFKNGGFSWS